MGYKTGYYINFKQDGLSECTICPFNEKDIALVLEKSSVIVIENVFIQSFGKSVDFDKFYTETDFSQTISFIEIISFLNSLKEYSINNFEFKVKGTELYINLKDEVITKFKTNKDLSILIHRICSVLEISDCEKLFTLIINNKNKYVCFNKSMEYEIFRDFWEMKENSKIIER
jgi:hypothetical protein